MKRFSLLCIALALSACETSYQPRGFTGGVFGFSDGMKRDLDLMREILLRVEASEDPVYPPWLPDRGREELQLIAHQVMLLNDAGYIEASNTPPETIGTIFRITNRGHDYLDSVRDPKVWKETKAKLEKVGGGGPLEFVKEMAAKTMAELIKSSLGG